MHDDDEKLRTVLQAWQRQTDGRAPAFDAVFAAAEGEVRVGRRNRYGGIAAAAAVAALLIFLVPKQEDEFIYVDLEELTGSTSWSAPSDSLLPKHQFDIYREMPRLFESTETDEGALL